MIEMLYQPKRKIEVLHSGIYQDYKFAIINLGTHPTAYVECKLDNCNSYGDERLNTVIVHGGFTYMGEAYWDKLDKTVYIGWDYAHCMDYAGYEINFPDDLRTNGRKWTTGEIFDEVKSVIEQLSGIRQDMEEQRR